MNKTEDEKKTRISHFRRISPDAGIVLTTMVSIPLLGEFVAVGFSHCSASDNISYQRGRQIAEGRARKVCYAETGSVAHATIVNGQQVFELIKEIRQLEAANIYIHPQQIERELGITWSDVHNLARRRSNKRDR